VEVLTTDNFDSFIENGFILVEFYAPWCGHCKKLAPEYSKAATTLKTSGSPVKLGMVDATVETSLGERFAIRGYPTLKFFRGGVPVDYDGGRTAADIVQWVTKKSGPPSRPLSTQAEISTLLSGSGTRAIAYVTGDQAEVWEDVAEGEKLQAFAFYHISDPSLFGTNQAGAAELHKDGEEVIRFSGNFKESELTQWLLAEGFPLVDELSQDSWNRFTKSGLDLLAVFQKETEGNSAALSVAKAYKGELIVTSSNQFEIATQWGATGKVVPTAIYATSKGGQPSFVVWNEDTNAEFNTESLMAFVVGARDGTYEPFIKSEPIPENNDGPVTVLVGKNFESIAMTEGKDVLVEFYAPWCGHCKKLAPIFDELGEHYQNDGNIVIAKMDATANGTPKGVAIQGFPTLIFWDASNTQHPYQGERDLITLKKFVDSHRISTPSAAGKEDL